jgi:hypothetical protein
MKKKFIFFLIIGFLIFPIKNISAVVFTETASCSFGDFWDFDPLGGVDYEPISQSCDITAIQEDKINTTDSFIQGSVIYIFYGIMLIAFLILILIFLVLPK